MREGGNRNGTEAKLWAMIQYIPEKFPQNFPEKSPKIYPKIQNIIGICLKERRGLTVQI